MAYSNPRDSVFNKPKPVVTLPAEILDGITQSAQPYPIPQGRKFEYGTAGVSSASFFSSLTSRSR